MDINKTASVIEKKLPMKSISKVIVVILVISTVLLVFMLIALGLKYIQDFLSNTGTTSILGIGDIVYSSPSEKIQAIFLCTLYLVSMVLTISANVLLWVFFSEIASENKPFLPGQGKRLQNIALLLMVHALLVALCNTWALTLLAESMHGVVFIWTFVTSLGGGMLYPLIIFCMALIFNYGMRLQTESDETL